MQGIEGSTPTGGTCPNDFSDPIDQDIRTQWALSWKIVVSEWRLVIAVSLNVGGGVRLIKPAKLCMCTQNTTNTTRTDARHRVCAVMVPYRWATRGTSLRELEYTHTYIEPVHIYVCHALNGSEWKHPKWPYCSYFENKILLCQPVFGSCYHIFCLDLVNTSLIDQ